MNHNSKMKFDQEKERITGENTNEAPNENYFRESSTRNICFELPNGNMTFLNYSYLVKGEYLQEEDKIILYFTSDTVTMEGKNLKPLHLELMQHLPRLIACSEQRYNGIADNEKSLINKLEIRRDNNHF